MSIEQPSSGEWSFVRGTGNPENPESWEKWEALKEAIAWRFDELATDPSLKGAGIRVDIGEKVRRGEKVDGYQSLWDALSGVAHDLRLSHDETDILRRRIFNEP